MKNAIFSFFFLLSTFAFSQELINNESLKFTIKSKNKNIDFIIYDDNLEQKKPVLLWCQGSLPFPLYVKRTNDYWMIGGGITNFDTDYIKKYYHLVVISMPETPVIVEEDQISKSYWFNGDSEDKTMPSLTFQKADFLENYVERGIAVLEFLRKQKWVDNTKLIVAGHSQGSKVASKIATNYKHVSKVGLFAANPFGRMDQNIRSYRKMAERKEISWEDADKYIEQEYQMYRDALDENKIKEKPYLLAWKSFSEPLIDDWLALNKPIYLAFGTNDIAADLCDMVPLYFMKEHKLNLTFKRYLDADHNFFKVNSEGKPNYENPQWPEVMNAFIDWTLK